MVQVALPAVVNGTSVDTGTPFDEDFRDGCAEAIDDVCHSTTNPLESCNGIQDEVVEARGNASTLKERLDAATDDNGDLLTAAATSPGQYSLSFLQNLIINDLLESWSQGDTAAPDGWELTGAGASIARTGAGLSDTTAPIIGRWLAKVTAGGGATAYLRQKISPAAMMAYLYQLNALNGGGGTLTLALLGQGKTAVLNALRTFILIDSVGETIQASHAGGSALSRLPSLGLSPAWASLLATDNIYVGYKIAAGEVAYCGPMSSFPAPSELTPSVHIPCRVVRKQHVVHFAGNQSTGTRKWAWTPQRPGIITSVQIAVGTAPATTDLVFDLNTWDGAALTTMFATKPKVVAAATFGAAFAPDGTYARKCFTPSFSALAAGGLVTLDCDQIGTGTVGADASVTINYIEFARPWDALFAFDQV